MFFLSKIEGLWTEDVIHCKAHWGNVIVIFDYINKTFEPRGVLMFRSYLQDTNLPGFLIMAVFAGLYLSLKMAQSVSEELLIQLVVVSLLNCKQKLLLLSWHLVKRIIILETEMSDWMFIIVWFCMLYHTETWIQPVRRAPWILCVKTIENTQTTSFS